jgi:hypothetical protein
MVRAAALLAILLMSCQQVRPAGMTASSSQHSTPVAAVSFSCRLPVMAVTAGRLTGGFIEFPAGKYFADPASTFTPDQSMGTFRLLSASQPELAGSLSLLFYDRTMSRWLPTNRSGISQDGTKYAYVTRPANQSVHVVDVATGSERTFSAPHPVGAEVYSYSPSGIYLAGRGGGAESGLWLLNPQTGAERLVTSEKIVAAVGDGKAWLAELSDSKNGPYTDTVVAFDLTSGSKTTWFQRAGLVWTIGLTRAGMPIVSVRTASASEVWLIESPGNGKKIYSGPAEQSEPTTDSHGIWFRSDDGIYLYANSGELQKVSNQFGVPAGECV